jgi:sugar O-acyltransferase (sialic acid O-acetyltransferase NeuD family)
MPDWIIYGAGGLGREIQAYLYSSNLVGQNGSFLGFIDDGKPAGAPVGDSKILGNKTTLISAAKPTAVLMGIADPAAKASLYEELSQNSYLTFPTLIHPLAYVEPSAILKAGTVISPYCVVSVNAVLGIGTLLNVGSQVGHDSVLGDFCSVMPHVAISGNVTVGARTFIGVGAKILQGISVGSDATIGIGGIVVSKVSDRTTVFGNPAKVIKK